MEDLMYYVWQQRIFSSIVMLDDTPIEIINPGLRNLDAGPDFFNAKVKIGDMVWAGNVEMHVRASDWFKHHHHQDPAYDNVILHVVLQADSVVCRTSGEPIKTVVMRIPEQVLEQYNKLVATDTNLYSAIRCQAHLASIPNIIFKDWQTALATQRMQNKASRILDLVENGKDSWEEALYVIIARSLGTGLNSDTFERLARSLPFSFLLKHMDDPFQIRALLLGQADLIPNYEEKMQQEYNFMRAKFSLTPLPAHAWKMAKLRPQAAPNVRIEAFATILTTHKKLFSEVIEAQDITSLQRILNIPYKIGIQTTNSIIINAVVPILIAYGQWKAEEEYCEKGIRILESIPAEANHYINNWISAGIPVRNAFDTQALLQLYREYCEPHKCMNCRIGCWLIKNRKP